MGQARLRPLDFVARFLEWFGVENIDFAARGVPGSSLAPSVRILHVSGTDPSLSSLDNPLLPCCPCLSSCGGNVSRRVGSAVPLFWNGRCGS